MSLTDGDGSPNASMTTAAKADGFQWIAFCTGTSANKALRAKRDSRTCVNLFDKESFTGISLVGQVEVSTDPVLKNKYGITIWGTFSTDIRMKIYVFCCLSRRNIIYSSKTLPYEGYSEKGIKKGYL